MLESRRRQTKEITFLNGMSYWQLTFWNLTFGLVRIWNKQGEDFCKKICLLTCAIAKTMNIKRFLSFSNFWIFGRNPTLEPFTKKTFLVELPCETICVTVFYKLEVIIDYGSASLTETNSRRKESSFPTEMPLIKLIGAANLKSPVIARKFLP